mmetsp:Transcript_24107/g.24363  ORF Transcript_24107/g.24363 Transcript_24107/m.24363 type:complete len:219 (+) Transcript_24107:70-726(+)
MDLYRDIFAVDFFIFSNTNLFTFSTFVSAIVMENPRVIILPGNGCTPVNDANWYSFMANKLEKSTKFSEIILHDMPDPYEAKEIVWLPYIRNEMKVDPNTIVIGHSSGAVAGLRLLESDAVLGLVLVSACHTDLGEESERISGYYSRPWNYATIKQNAQWILQFHSDNDPFIPRHEADHVAKSLDLIEGVEYYCYPDKSHYFTSKDVLPIIDQILLRV